jgi:hypothetical protein
MFSKLGACLLKHQNLIRCENSGRVKEIIFLNDDYLLCKMLFK